MTADDFAKTVRDRSTRLRVDKVVVSVGKERFRGSGTLRVAEERFEMDVVLSIKSKAPLGRDGRLRAATDGDG